MKKMLFSILVVSFFIGSNLVLAGPPPKKTPAIVAKGKQLFAANCVACHGEKGAGDGAAAAALTPKPRNFANPKEKFKNGEKVENIFKTLAEGVPGSAMVAYSFLSEEDRWALAYFVTELRKAK